MMRIWRWHSIVVVALGLVLGAALPVVAKQDDKPGWSFQTDQQKRALLIFVPAKDAPRSLTIGCLRTAEIFEVLVEDVGNVKTAVTGVSLTLTNGKASFEAKGEIGFFASTKSFDSNMIVDANALRRIRDTLLPVLEGPGPIVLTLGSLKRELPVSGLADPLKRFKTACFGA
jgi:hypothetical protein